MKLLHLVFMLGTANLFHKAEIFYLCLLKAETADKSNTNQFYNENIHL